MSENRKSIPWVRILSILVCVLAGGYYFLDKAFTVSTADTKITTKTDQKRTEVSEIKRREDAAKTFIEILNGAPERLVEDAILKGDSDSAARIAKIWEMSEPANTIAQSLNEAFRRTRTCGNESCSVHLTSSTAALYQ